MFDSNFCFVSPLLSRLLSASPTGTSSERLPVGDLLWSFEVPAELGGSGSSETCLSSRRILVLRTSRMRRRVCKGAADHPGPDPGRRGRGRSKAVFYIRSAFEPFGSVCPFKSHLEDVSLTQSCPHLVGRLEAGEYWGSSLPQTRLPSTIRSFYYDPKILSWIL